MTFFNKVGNFEDPAPVCLLNGGYQAVLSLYKFEYEMTILLIQLVVSIAVLRLMSSTGLIPPLEDVTAERAKKVRPSRGEQFGT